MLGLGIDINKISFLGGFAFSDADAQAYYDALVTANGGDIDSVTLYSIPLNTFKAIIDSHVVQLKADSVWSNLVRYYPFIGGTDVTHAINMVNAASELTYVGAPTHSKEGMILNGTTQYANLNNDPTADLTANDTHMMLLVENSDSSQHAFGSILNANTRMWVWCNNSINFSSDMYSSNIAGGREAVSSVITSEKVLVTSRLSTTDYKLYTDGVEGASDTNTVVGALTSNTMYLGTSNSNGTPIYYLDGVTRAASIGDGLTPTETAAYNTEAKALQLALGRVYDFTDADARAYWSALTVANGGVLDCQTLYGKTNAVIMEAVDDFYVALKVDATYSEMGEMLLYIGGTDVTHAISSIAASSVLTYTGAPTHGSAGMNLNNSTQYGELPSAPAVYSATDDNHICMFANSTSDELAMGSRDGGGDELWMRTNAALTLEFASQNSSGGGYITSVESAASFDKVCIGSRISNIRTDIYVDGSSVSNGILTSGTVPATQPVYIGALNLAGFINNPMGGDVKFSSIGTGLTSSQATTLTNSVKTLNTTLGR